MFFPCNSEARRKFIFTGVPIPAAVSLALVVICMCKWVFAILLKMIIMLLIFDIAVKVDDIKCCVHIYLICKYISDRSTPYEIEATGQISQHAFVLE